ncbi:hypothetical protein NIES80_40280 [Dolichospermum planctonicum]|uniref:Uncharacterized protein n=1 Tax=Dolichospermum planctonicum TaxID=136072 RepID=A0A480AML2_9CYAN|nr:hypothetical protein NIES80_40280 [Dolichospermum planctonicum]
MLMFPAFPVESEVAPEEMVLLVNLSLSVMSSLMFPASPLALVSVIILPPFSKVKLEVVMVILPPFPAPSSYTKLPKKP